MGIIKALTLQRTAECFIEITRQVQQAVQQRGCKQSVCMVDCPQTTAGLTINENADPDVVDDVLLSLRKAFPACAQFHHSEGNSYSHLRATAVGFSQLVPIEDESLLLGC